MAKVQMPLPSGKTSSFMGVYVQTIYDHFERESAHVVESIREELIKETPVDTGNLKSAWKAGAFPTKKEVIRPTDGTTVNQPPFKPVKRYGLHYRYYIWNNARISRDGANIPYLEWVNAGIVKGGGTSKKAAANRGFVQRAIQRGVKKAMGL